jgi:hypothetical protein
MSAAPTRLTGAQMLILIAYGALLWLLAAMLVRAIGPLGWLIGGARLITYALVIPGTLPAIWIARRIARLDRNQALVSVTLLTATALLLDGVAHAWFRSLYGSDPALIVAGAGAIFWGAGVALTLALIMQRNLAGD